MPTLLLLYPPQRITARSIPRVTLRKFLSTARRNSAQTVVTMSFSPQFLNYRRSLVRAVPFSLCGSRHRTGLLPGRHRPFVHRAWKVLRFAPNALCGSLSSDCKIPCPYWLLSHYGHECSSSLPSSH
jgi:hypothetical protein